MPKAKIAVIIPTYNRKQVIGRALDSVLAQTYRDYCIYIVDDGSTDETQEMIENRYRSFLQNGTIRWIASPERKGPSSARNLGILHSSEPLIAFLDSDDAWHPKKLEEQVQYVQSKHHILYCHTDEQWIYRGKERKPKKRHRKQGGYFFIRSLDLCLISPSSVMMQRQFFDRVGLFDESLFIAEDYELWIRAQNRYPAGFIPKPLTIKYGGREDQLSSQYYNIDLFRIKALIGLYHKDYFTQRKRRLIAHAIKSKYKIILNGFAKRNKTFPPDLAALIEGYIDFFSKP